MGKGGTCFNETERHQDGGLNSSAPCRIWFQLGVPNPSIRRVARLPGEQPSKPQKGENLFLAETLRFVPRTKKPPFVSPPAYHCTCRGCPMCCGIHQSNISKELKIKYTCLGHADVFAMRRLCLQALRGRTQAPIRPGQCFSIRSPRALQRTQLTGASRAACPHLTCPKDTSKTS